MKLFTLLFLISTTIHAQEIVDQTINTQVEASNVSIEIQNKIDELDIESKKIYFDYKDTLNEFNSLKNYDDQLSKIIDAQIIEISSINEQLDSLDSINIDILPLLKRMVDSLSKFITLDIPFLIEERKLRLQDLDALIVRADVTTAEKFRKIFEAYQLEANFGKTIESYQGFLTIKESEKAVDYFRLGRLGLYYRTPNGKETGYWNSNSQQWVHEGSSLDDEIKAALDIANRQSPPNFIKLPVKPLVN
ncbi:MAG: DUF3450 domain-containing protein [Gammaproteobacteria bacterium]|tara:strand:- start:8609 stop:9352 length:744 start_codon:yes stop_codon:yes gene_type:complete